MTSAYEFSFRYDEESVRIASRTLFKKTYGRLLRWVLPISVPSLVGIVLISRYTGVAELNWMLILPVISGLGWLNIYWAQARRLVRTLQGESRVQLTETDFSISSDRGSHTWPWKTFKYSVRDSRNVLLFVGRGVAIVVPTQGASGEALDFLLSHVPPNR